METDEETKLLSIKDILFVTIVAFVTIVTSVFVARPVRVQGESMETNYHDGEFYIMERISYYTDEPKRFDVIVFPEDNKLLIKRIIGLPGETVRIDEMGNIYINDELLSEDYGAEVITPVREDGSENLGIAASGCTLNADEYFVLGDNRNKSNDSRFLGPVESSRIKGKVWIKIF